MILFALRFPSRRGLLRVAGLRGRRCCLLAVALQGHDIAGHLLRKGLGMAHKIPRHRLPNSLFATLIATQMGEPLDRENGYRLINIMIVGQAGDVMKDRAGISDNDFEGQENALQLRHKHCTLGICAHVLCLLVGYWDRH